MRKTKTDIIISDHALVRYLERVKGVNLNPIRDEIKLMISNSCTLEERNWFRKNFRAVFDNRTLVTIMFKKTHKSKRYGKRRKNNKYNNL